MKTYKELQEGFNMRGFWTLAQDKIEDKLREMLKKSSGSEQFKRVDVFGIKTGPTKTNEFEMQLKIRFIPR